MRQTNGRENVLIRYSVSFILYDFVIILKRDLPHKRYILPNDNHHFFFFCLILYKIVSVEIFCQYTCTNHHWKRFSCYFDYPSVFSLFYLEYGVSLLRASILSDKIDTFYCNFSWKVIKSCITVIKMNVKLASSSLSKIQASSVQYQVTSFPVYYPSVLLVLSRRDLTNCDLFRDDLFRSIPLVSLLY